MTVLRTAIGVAVGSVLGGTALWGVMGQVGLFTSDNQNVGYVSPAEQTAGMPHYTVTTISIGVGSECVILLLDKGEQRAIPLLCGPAGGY